MSHQNKIEAPTFIYRLLFPIWFLFWLIHAFLHAFKYKEWIYVSHRLGFNPKSEINSIWIHAASVGEVNLIKPLCERLLAQGHNITLTTFTATGLQRAKELFSTQVCIHALPMDCWPISWLFAYRLNAKCALIAETELWPETLYQVAYNSTPLIHINARLSKKSLQAPSIIKSLLSTTLSYFTVHFCRYNSDIENFESMGIAKQNIFALGNLKYAQTPKLETYKNLINQPYLLFASSHHNEEVMFTSLLENNELNLPLMVIAPRHPSRCKDIIKSITQSSLTEQQISIRSKNQKITNDTKVYLADTFGEMNHLAQHADIVIMAGSFVDIGGHNILEPAALGCCIITGPSDNNIKHDVTELKQHKAIVQVQSIEELAGKLSYFLKHEKERLELGNNAAQFVKNAQGILNNYVTQIEKILNIKP